VDMSDFLRSLKDYGFVVGAFTGSLAAYLLGLIISHMRREKRWLGYKVFSRTVADKGGKDLEFSFKGKPITRLDSHIVLLFNVGNRPLTDLLVRIVAHPQAKILEEETDAPAGMGVTTTIKNDVELNLVIDLLNPKERICTNLTISDSASGNIQILARIPGLSLIELNERIATNEHAIEVDPGNWTGR
jgi:hypothetical protein